MSVDNLRFGTSISGLLIDGDPDTLYTVCTLTMAEPDGPIIEVPYIFMGETNQFDAPQKWFSSRTPPSSMIFKTSDGDISLFDIQWSGHTEKSGSGLSLGRIRPTEMVLHRRDGKLDDSLRVSEMRSHIDGLKEWTQLSAIKDNTETNESGLIRKVTVEVESISKLEWQQGDVTMTLQTDWRTSHAEEFDAGSLNVFDWVVFETKFETPQLINKHLSVHRKLQHLLVLVFDSPIHFRKHQVRDRAFALRLMSGELVNNPFVELISRRTVNEYAEKFPTKKDLQHPLFKVGLIGSEGLAQWTNEYERWQRFILPAVSVLGKRRIYIEDLIVSLSMSLEAAGKIIGHRDGEEESYWNKRPTTSTFVYRCLHLLDLNWGSRVESITGLARAAANSYNGTKHFNEGEMPDPDESFLISQVLKEVARLLALHIVDYSGDLLSRHPGAGISSQFSRIMETAKLRITHSGTWESSPNLRASLISE
ncbi:hypothetical protein [Mycetocola saprophilus]|uniref:ApeA N-terminal domain 1-containing protein n=1 Tax=Mycetocola saprophilus TaxID=76636 RepID=UPI003BF10423